MKKATQFALVIVFLAVNFIGLSQQYAQFSQYMVNPFLINPALSGAEDYLDIKMGYRTQWTGFQDAPRTMYLGAHSPLGKEHGVMTHKGDDHNWHGVGGLIMNDVTGPTARTSGYANYSYNLKITEGSGFGTHHKDGIRLSIGAFAGFQQYRVDASKLTTEIEGDDALLGEGVQTKFVPDVSLGAMLYFRELFYVGVSSFQVLGSSLKINGLGSDVNPLITDESRLARHYMVSAGSKLWVGEDLFLIPSFLIKTVGPAPISVDLNTRVDYQDKYYGGLSYRHGDAISVMAGIVVDRRYEIAYSYDLTITDIKSYSNGTHEVIVGFRLPPPFAVRNADDWF